MNFTSTYRSPIGVLTLASDGDSLVGLWLEGQKHFGGGLRDPVPAPRKIPLLENAEQWLDRYFAGEKPSPSTLPLCPAGSDFRQRVWAALTEIPYGTVVSYGDVAVMAARKGCPPGGLSPRAVGGAVGHNPLAIIVPCHRVVGSNGNLTGYAGGVDRKIRLLEHEGVDTARLKRPK